jgi:hypothetical protein
MEGTANPMDQITTQIALFARMCEACELPSDQGPANGRSPCQPATTHYKLLFAGCGVSHGLRGTIFAHGLREQCSVIRQYLRAFVEEGHFVKLNFVGLSRGGIGGLYLAQELKNFSKSQVLLNMLLFDPVPGNLIWMSRFVDVAGIMNANQAMDVSSVDFLNRVIVLYPHEPLPDIAFHAPLIAQFPANCDLEEDVILGCHQGALWLRPRPDTCLAFARIRDFLLDSGSRLDRSNNIAMSLDLQPQRLVEMLNQELRYASPTDRSAHGPNGGANIVRRSTGQFLCRSHKLYLEKVGARGLEAGNGDEPAYMLDIER